MAAAKPRRSACWPSACERGACDVLETAEPGGTPIGQQIRRMLLDAANRELRPTAELLLMFAARAQNVEELILPALDRGADRRVATASPILRLPIRAPGEDWAAETVLEVDRIACHGLVPDLTLCIDIDTLKGLERAHSRNRLDTSKRESRLDEQALDFHQKARDAYHELARREPQRFRLIDGSGSPDATAAKVWEEVSGLIEQRVRVTT